MTRSLWGMLSLRLDCVVTHSTCVLQAIKDTELDLRTEVRVKEVS